MYPTLNIYLIPTKQNNFLLVWILALLPLWMYANSPTQVQDSNLEKLIQTYRYNHAIKNIEGKLAKNETKDSTVRLYYLTKLSSLHSRKGDVQAAYKTSLRGRFLYPFVSDSLLITEARLTDAISNINKGNFSYALEELEKSKSSIQRLKGPCNLERTLSHAYSLIFMQNGKLPDAFREIERAIHLDTSCQLKMYLANDLLNLSLLHFMKGDLEESQKTIERATEIARIQKDSIVWGGCLLMQGHLFYVAGNTDQWKANIYFAIELGKKISHPFLITGGYTLFMEKALQQKQYAEAITLGSELEKIMEDHPLPTFQFHLDSLLYEAYKGHNNREKALQYFESFYRNKRKIFNESFKDQIHDLQTNYELKEKNLLLEASRKELINTQKKQEFLYVIIGLLSLLVISIFAIRELKRNHAKRLYQKEKLLEGILKEEKQMFGINRPAYETVPGTGAIQMKGTLTEDEQEDNSQDQDDRRELYDEILRLMEEEKIYLNPDLTQKHLITQLATNKKYLYQAISRNAEDNFKNLLNRYRVAEAKRLIENSVHGKNDDAVDQVFRSAGFNSETSYYRAFKHFTGLTPKEYAREYKRDVRS